MADVQQWRAVAWRGVDVDSAWRGQWRDRFEDALRQAERWAASDDLWLQIVEVESSDDTEYRVWP